MTDFAVTHGKNGDFTVRPLNPVPTISPGLVADEDIDLHNPSYETLFTLISGKGDAEGYSGTFAEHAADGFHAPMDHVISDRQPSLMDQVRDSLAKRKQNNSAASILRSAAMHIEDRAESRDKPSGERSMSRAVETFNAMTGHNLSEADGWLFMVYLKHSRSMQGATVLDDYEDAAAYEALRAEAGLRGKAYVGEYSGLDKPGE